MTDPIFNAPVRFGSIERDHPCGLLQCPAGHPAGSIAIDCDGARPVRRSRRVAAEGAGNDGQSRRRSRTYRKRLEMTIPSPETAIAVATIWGGTVPCGCGQCLRDQAGHSVEQLGSAASWIEQNELVLRCDECAAIDAERDTERRRPYAKRLPRIGNKVRSPSSRCLASSAPGSFRSA